MKKSTLMILMAGSVLASCGNKTNQENVKSNEIITEIPEPKFVKEGELSFVGKTGNEIKKIEIEIADDEQQQQQGLMYRKSMPETQGMLFIFPNSEPRSFWMHNTYISLDIIYANEKNEIVKIFKSAKPLDEGQNLNSVLNAQYVVEVVGGFCDKFGVAEGDKISFTKM